MPSRRRASANFLSAWTCCCTSSLKLLVLAFLAIFRLRSAPRAFALFIGLPITLSRPDVPLLAFLGAARQQDHKRVAVASEIDPVSRPENRSDTRARLHQPTWRWRSCLVRAVRSLG